MKFTHSTRLITAVAPVRQGWSKKREIVRWTLSFIVYFAWVSTYIAFYIFSLMKLVMLGDNPFDYGQVAYILVSFSRLRVPPPVSPPADEANRRACSAARSPSCVVS